jgi:hypothetical protein
MPRDPRPHMQGRPGDAGWAAVIRELERRNPDKIYVLSDAPSSRNVDSGSAREDQDDA